MVIRNLTQISKQPIDFGFRHALISLEATVWEATISEATGSTRGIWISPCILLSGAYSLGGYISGGYCFEPKNVDLAVWRRQFVRQQSRRPQFRPTKSGCRQALTCARLSGGFNLRAAVASSQDIGSGQALTCPKERICRMIISEFCDSPIV